MSTAVPSDPVVIALLAKLTADLPPGYGVFDAEGPENPATAVPYVVLYADPGLGDGAPLSPNRELTMTFSVRCIGSIPQQSRKAGDRVRASLDQAVLPNVGGRRVSIWQTHATPITRDDSLAPDVLFEHLLVFGLRSTL